MVGSDFIRSLFLPAPPESMMSHTTSTPQQQPIKLPATDNNQDGTETNLAVFLLFVPFPMNKKGQKDGMIDAQQQAVVATAQ